jgi:hypothetical protein
MRATHETADRRSGRLARPAKGAARARERNAGRNLLRDFSGDVPERSRPIFAPITFQADRERRRARVLIPDVFESRIEPIRNPKTGEEHRARIILPNGFEFKEAEVANTVRFEVKKPHCVAMRHENSYAQLSAFDWSN